MSDDLAFARKIMLERGASLVVVRDGDVLFIGRSGGLKDLAKIALGEPSLLEGSSIADKVVGKAAALIFSMNRAKAVYASLISSYGLEELQKSRIRVSYERLVPYIEAPGGGICPFEKLVLGFGDPREAYRRLLEKFEEVFGRL